MAGDQNLRRVAHRNCSRRAFALGAALDPRRRGHYFSPPTQGDLGKVIGRFLFGFGLVVAWSGPALAELAMTGAPVAMRAGPAGNAQIVQRIPASAEVEVAKCVARLVPSLVAESVRAISLAARSFSGPRPRRCRGRDAAAGRQRAADLCHAAGVAMDRRLCRGRFRLRLRRLVAPTAGWRAAAPTHGRRPVLYGRPTP